MASLRALRIPTGTSLRLLISLLLALLLWGWVTNERDPTIARTFTEVPLQAPILPEPFQVVNPPSAVEVRLEGPRSVVTDLVPSDLEARLDLRAVEGPGTYSPQVEVDGPDGVGIEEITPAQVPITVDQSVSQRFPLETEVLPLATDSQSEVRVNPGVSEVTVLGPATFVDAVERVVLPVEIGERTGDFTGRFTPVAEDANGNPIPEVQIQPESVEAMVQVEVRGRSFPVLTQTVGNPAEGYEVGDEAANPPTVLLDGPAEALENLVAVSAEPVSIEGATETITAQVGLADLPPGVHVVEPAGGTVLVVVQIRRRSAVHALAEQQVIVTDVAPGLTATIEPPIISVVVAAAEESLAGLTAGDVKPRVSVAGLGPGTYELSPSVSVPPEMQWLRTEPALVEVTLTVTGATPSAMNSTPRAGG